MEYLRSCLCMFTCLGVILGGLVAAGAAFWIDQAWLAFPAVAAVGVGIGALTSACGKGEDLDASNGGGSQVLEVTRV